MVSIRIVRHIVNKMGCLFLGEEFVTVPMFVCMRVFYISVYLFTRRLKLPASLRLCVFQSVNHAVVVLVCLSLCVSVFEPSKPPGQVCVARLCPASLEEGECSIGSLCTLHAAC